MGCSSKTVVKRMVYVPTCMYKAFDNTTSDPKCKRAKKPGEKNPSPVVVYWYKLGISVSNHQSQSVHVMRELNSSSSNLIIPSSSTFSVFNIIGKPDSGCPSSLLTFLFSPPFTSSFSDDWRSTKSLFPRGRPRLVGDLAIPVGRPSLALLP